MIHVPNNSKRSSNGAKAKGRLRNPEFLVRAYFKLVRIKLDLIVRSVILRYLELSMDELQK
jgi:hypothetical protein